MPKFVLYGLIVMLCASICPLPYSYYTFLKLLSFVVFIQISWIFYKQGNENMMWCSIVFSIVFNPLFPLTFYKWIWLAIDYVAALFLFLNQHIIISTRNKL